MVRGDRARLLERAAARDAADPVHLRMIFARDPKEPELRLRRFEDRPEYAHPGHPQGRQEGGGDAPGRPTSGPTPAARDPKVETMVVKNWFPDVEPTAFRDPAARLHHSRRRSSTSSRISSRLGIEVGVFSQDLVLDVEGYTIGDDHVRPRYDYLAPEVLDVSTTALRGRPAKRGTSTSPASSRRPISCPACSSRSRSSA